MNKSEEYYQKQADNQFPHLTQYGKLTIPGVFYQHIFQYDLLRESIGILKPQWKDSTIEDYMGKLYQTFFPALPPEQAIEDYTAEQLDGILNKLKVKNEYKDSTVEKFELLIWRIFQVGHKNGYCEDILWGTHYERGNSRDIESVETSVQEAEKTFRLRKSLNAEEEKEAVTYLLEDPETSSGENIGLLLMLLTGMRNSDACGLLLGDLKVLQEYPDTWTLWIYKSTKRNSNELKGSGKTRNASRILPIFDALAKFLLQRIQFIESLVECGDLPEDTDVKSLPMVCRGTNYTIGCSSGNLSVAGKSLLKKINVSSRQVAYLDHCVFQSQFQQNGLDEKDGTTYLLRRNFATHLKNADFNMPKIQYYMGHDIESLYETRSGFTNEQKLQEIKKLIDKMNIRGL